MALFRKPDQSCANCTAFYYMGLAGDHTTGRGQCLAHPAPLIKSTADWCREWELEKKPEREIAEDNG
jgi:hypothetical protein